MRPQVRVYSIMEIVSDWASGRIVPGGFARNRSWSSIRVARYLSDIFDTGYLAPIVVCEKQEPGGSKYILVDGYARIDVLRRIADPTHASVLLFDALNRVFRDRGARRSRSSFFEWQATDCTCCLSTVIKQVIASGATDEEKCTAIDALQDLRGFVLEPLIPLIIYTDHSLPINVFQRISETGSWVDTTAISLESCSCRTVGPVRRRTAIDTPADNLFIQSSRLDVTNHNPFFGLEDVECAVNTVECETVQALAFDFRVTSRFVQILVNRLRDCVPDRMNDKLREEFKSNAQELREVIDILRHRHRRLSDSEPGEEGDALAAVAEFAAIISRLQDLIHYARALLWDCPRGEGSPKQVLPALSVTPVGCFLGTKASLCGFNFQPGVYVSKRETESEDVELLAHELTHAYIYTHRKANVFCLWVEEGLAELCGELTRKQYSGPLKLDPGLIDYSDVKHGLMFYEFLETVRKMSATDVKRLFDTYLDPGDEMSWLQGLVSPYCEWNR